MKHAGSFGFELTALKHWTQIEDNSSVSSTYSSQLTLLTLDLFIHLRVCAYERDRAEEKHPVILNINRASTVSVSSDAYEMVDRRTEIHLWQR